MGTGYWRLIACALLCSSIAGPAAAADGENASLTPFIWAPSVDGSLSFGPVTVPLHASPGDLASGAQSGIMLYGDGEAHGAFIFGQLIAVKFSDKSFEPLLNLNVKSELVSAELGGGKPIRWRQLSLTPIAALRYTYIAGQLSAGTARTRLSRRWTELLVGIVAGYQVTDGLDLHVRYTRAVSGPAGQDNWDALAGARYRLTRSIAVVGGYRLSQQRISQTDRQPFAFRLRGKGPLIGLTLGL